MSDSSTEEEVSHSLRDLPGTPSRSSNLRDRLGIDDDTLVKGVFEDVAQCPSNDEQTNVSARRCLTTYHTLSTSSDDCLSDISESSADYDSGYEDARAEVWAGLFAQKAKAAPKPAKDAKEFWNPNRKGASREVDGSGILGGYAAMILMTLLLTWTRLALQTVQNPINLRRPNRSGKFLIEQLSRWQRTK